MKKKSSIIRTLFATVFMFTVLCFTMMFGMKANAEEAIKVKITDEGVITSELIASKSHAVKISTTITSENGSFSIEPGIYYFDDKGILSDLGKEAVLPYFATEKTIVPGTKAFTEIKKAVKDNITTSSSVKYKTGIINNTIYQNGNLYTKGYEWIKNAKDKKYYLYEVSNGKKGAVHTGVVTGTYFDPADGASGKFKSFGNGWYVKKGLLTTAVVNLRYYAGGKASTYTGWKKISTKIYYIKSGKALTGWQKNVPSYGKNGKKYTYRFDDKGVLQTDLIWGKLGYGYKNFLKRKIKIVVNMRKNTTTFYTTDDGKNYNIPCLTIICATARSKGDTPVGHFRLEKTWNKRWYVYTKTNGAPFRYYQWAVKIHGTSSLFHSSAYRTNKVSSLRVDLYNKLCQNKRNITTHCVRHQVKYAKLIYDIATYNISNIKWRKTRVWVDIGRQNKYGPFGKIPNLKKLKKGTKYDPTDPYRK